MSSHAEATIDLPAYFHRIAYAGPTQPSAAVLRDLHRAHVAQIPFENVDVLLGVPIRLDLAALQAKLVAARWGGYCFEQNLLFAAVLEQLGFPVKRLLARVRYRATRVLPLTHMALEVEADGKPWLADVGFGGDGLLEPLRLAEEEGRQGAWRFRLTRSDERWWVLQAPDGDRWCDLYTFTRDPHLPVDYEPANYYVSHYPESRFVRTFTAQRIRDGRRLLLVDRELTTNTGLAITSRTLNDDAELQAFVNDVIGLPIANLPAVLARQQRD